jgi:hypothetical protein
MCSEQRDPLPDGAVVGPCEGEGCDKVLMWRPDSPGADQGFVHMCTGCAGKVTMAHGGGHKIEVPPRLAALFGAGRVEEWATAAMGRAILEKVPVPLAQAAIDELVAEYDKADRNVPTYAGGFEDGVSLVMSLVLAAIGAEQHGEGGALSGLSRNHDMALSAVLLRCDVEADRGIEKAKALDYPGENEMEGLKDLRVRAGMLIVVGRLMDQLGLSEYSIKGDNLDPDLEGGLVVALEGDTMTLNRLRKPEGTA